MTYYPMDLARAELWLGFHIPGLAQDVRGRFVAGVHLSEIPWPEWQWVEQREVVDMSAGYYIEANHVFACFGCGTSAESHAEFAELLDTYLDVQYDRVRLLLWGLRLHKAGHLIDPVHSVIYIKFGNAATTEGSINTRIPGLYRQRMLEEVKPSYQLHSDEVEAAEGLVEALEVYEAYWENLAVDIALRAFNNSYMPYLTPAQRLVFLFPALEAVYGEYRKRTRGVSLGGVASMLASPERSDRIREYLDGAARTLRNQIGHGAATTSVSAEAGLPIVEEAVRTGLRCLIEFTIRFRHVADDAVKEVHGADRDSPTRTFVALLVAAAKGEPAGLELLRRQVPFSHGLDDAP